jgi:hypothetical protein
MGCDMLARLFRTAPVLAVAALLCACCLFASDPPMPFAGYTSGASLQNAPVVVEAKPSKLATMTGPRRQASALSPCKGDNDCDRMLGALINDPKRGWLTEPQSAAEYANGARFFAYRALRRTLSCRELILASQDLTIAAARLSAPSTAVSGARAASPLSLSTAVAAELRNEITDRC